MNCYLNHNIVVFDVRDPDVTVAHCFIETEGDCPFMVQGWHRKEFPSSMNTGEILQDMFSKGGVDISLWPQSSAPELPE